MSRLSRRQVRRWSRSFRRPRWKLIATMSYITRWDDELTQNDMVLH